MIVLNRRPPLGIEWSPRVRVAAWLVAMMLLAATGCAGEPEHPLRLATSPWPGYQSLHLAQSLSYVTRETVQLVELRNNSQSMDAMRAGTVDAATTTLDEALVLRQDGVDVRIVLVFDRSRGADVVMARPTVSSLSDLRGKRIGVETAAVGAVMLDALLSATNLTLGDVTLVPLPVNAHEDAFAAGKFDAVVTYEPVRTRLLAAGAKVIFDSRQIPDRILDVLVVRADAVPRHAAALRALVAAHFNALDYLTREPRDAAARIAPHLGVAPVDVRPQFTGIEIPGVADNYEFLAGAEPGLDAIARDLSELMLRRRLLRERVEIDPLVDPTFLPTALP
jgi:NitT/TauT family transport system substrate-binding protein